MIVVINKNNILHNYYSIYNKNIFNKMIIIVDIRIGEKNIITFPFRD